MMPPLSILVDIINKYNITYIETMFYFLRFYIHFFKRKIFLFQLKYHGFSNIILRWCITTLLKLKGFDWIKIKIENVVGIIRYCNFQPKVDQLVLILQFLGTVKHYSKSHCVLILKYFSLRFTYLGKFHSGNYYEYEKKKFVF